MSFPRILSVALLVSPIVLVVGGCEEASVEAETAANGQSFAAVDFTGGMFQLSVLSVDDGCLDGSLQLMFMPDGNLEPYSLAFPTEFPSAVALPSSFRVQLKEPFSTLEMELVGVQGDMLEVAEATQANVLLGVPGSGACSADLGFLADITVSSNDTLLLRTRVTLDGFLHPDCPTVQETPCEVILEMRGDRI